MVVTDWLIKTSVIKKINHGAVPISAHCFVVLYMYFMPTN